ncbi:MAG TPA: hypothetical protein VLP43_03435 [Solirubrobacteraceae bacterium]|nr:hypothetical protein [Solirubrobacteraceae bacterium]
MHSSTETPSSTALADAGLQLQQKDNLCGPFHAARTLRDIGVTEWEGAPVDQDLVALHAGTALPEREIGPQVPPGAANLRDYRYELPRVEQAASGTSPAALAAAISELSGGRLVCVPVSGAWSTEVVERLVLEGRTIGARLMANIRSGLLWGSRPPLDLLIGRLAGEDAAHPPGADWDVGHFVELAEVVCGRRGALVVVQDSYPTLGWNGTHLQPPGALAAALSRGDGKQGGVLAVSAPELETAVRELVAEVGMSSEMWDNSSTGGSETR